MKAGDLLIDESEIVETFVRSSGPGGQNVNKVASAVELRFDARSSPSLPNDVAIRLIKLAGVARHPGRRDRHFRPELRQPAAQSRGRASPAHGFAREGAGAAKAAPRHAPDAGLAACAASTRRRAAARSRR